MNKKPVGWGLLAVALVLPHMQCNRSSSVGPEGPRYVDPGEMGLKLLTPNGGERYEVGDTMVISWAVDTTKVFNSLHFDVSFDLGYTFSTINWNVVENRIYATDTTVHDGNVGTYRWVIPTEYYDPQYRQDFSTISDSCLVQIWEYDNFDKSDCSDSAFSIRDSGFAGGADRR